MLDIEEAAPRPGRAAALMLRRADPRRASTQAWRLVREGRGAARMACAHANLCVQPEHGLMGLAPGQCTGYFIGVLPCVYWLILPQSLSQLNLNGRYLASRWFAPPVSGGV